MSGFLLDLDIRDMYVGGTQHFEHAILESCFIQALKRVSKADHTDGVEDQEVVTEPIEQRSQEFAVQLSGSREKESLRAALLCAKFRAVRRNG